MKPKIKSQKVVTALLLVILFIPIVWFVSGYTSSYQMHQIDPNLLNEVDIGRIYNITEHLTNYRTRETGSLECNLAAADIYSMLNDTYNISDIFFESFTYNATSCFNVVGRINGTTLKDQLVLICAHYDSISLSGDAPGANDNGVAVAACMEVMGIIRNNVQLNRTLLFVSFAGEEQAFIGSQAWIIQHKTELSRVVAVLNLDMIGVGSGLRILKNDQSEWLADAVIYSSSAVNVSFRKSNTPYPETARFDHDTFWMAQVPCISLFEAGSVYAHYHTSDDTIDKISFPLVEKCAQATLATVFYLGTASFDHNPTNFSIIIWLSSVIAAVLPLILLIKSRKLFLVPSE